MINSVEQYLAELKKELAGSDRATMQDALSDAEEYLRTALDSAVKDNAHVSESEALASIIERYGQPKEVAAAYKEIESRTPPAFGRPAYKAVEPAVAPIPATPAVVDTRNFFTRFFGVFAEPRAWGSLFYLLFTLGTGIAYFTWAMTGFWTSFGLIFCLLLGIPLMFFFLLSIRGIALLEGRLVEALLGVRMPRRPIFSRQDVGLWQKMKNIFFKWHTWTALLYMVLQLPLGIFYFSVFVSLIAGSLALIFKPFFELVLGLPTFTIGDYGYFTPMWAMPLAVIGGALLLTATMHLVKYTGKLHGGFAKVMLVRE